MEDLNSENKNYLLNTIKSKALELSSRPLKKFIEDDSNKPADYNTDKKKIDLIIADLYLKIGTAKAGSPERQQIINNFFPSSALTLRKPSTSVSSKPSSDPDIVFTSNPLKKTEADKEKKKEEEKNEADALDQNNLLQLELDLDQIIYTKLDPKLKKKQLALIVINLKDKLETYKNTIDRTKYEEDLKKKLPKKNGLDDDNLFNLFFDLIDTYFTSYAIIISLIPTNIRGGLNFRYVDTEDQQMVYKSELDQAKKIKEIIKKIEEERTKQKNVQDKIDNKIKAVNDAAQKKIYLGDRIQCTKKITMGKLKEPGIVKDINYIPGKIYAYTVELLINNDFGTTEKQNLLSCKLLTSAEEEEEKKKQALIDEKTDFLSKQVARQYGFKIGDPIDCTTKDGKNISGVAKKFNYNLLKRKTYILIKEKDKPDNEKLTQIDVKYCANQYDYTLKNINKKKEKEYMKKQFSKLQEIIKKISKLSPNDENYEIIIKNLTNEYDIIESQINNTIESTSDSSLNCSEDDEECKSKASPRENPDVRISNTEDERLIDVRNKRIALLQLLQKVKPDEYLKVQTIIKRSNNNNSSSNNLNVGSTTGGLSENKYTAKLNQKNIKFKNSKLPILNTVKGGYNTYGLTQRYMQRAGNPDENINDIINNSNNLLNIMDKAIL
jgi:hypothetical protein